MILSPCLWSTVYDTFAHLGVEIVSLKRRHHRLPINLPRCNAFRLPTPSWNTRHRQSRFRNQFLKFHYQNPVGQILTLPYHRSLVTSRLQSTVKAFLLTNRTGSSSSFIGIKVLHPPRVPKDFHSRTTKHRLMNQPLSPFHPCQLTQSNKAHQHTGRTGEKRSFPTPNRRNNEHHSTTWDRRLARLACPDRRDAYPTCSILGWLIPLWGLHHFEVRSA